jgi:hypothetical protein
MHIASFDKMTLWTKAMRNDRPLAAAAMKFCQFASRQIRWVSNRPKVDGQGSEPAAEELPFEVHRARFVPVNSIL